MNVFIAALDWGLGHATRLTPVIAEEVKSGNNVIIGATTKQIAIYKEHFPTLTYELLTENPPLFSKRQTQVLALISFLPGFLKQIRQDQNLLKSLVSKYEIEKVISDNRYGLFHAETKNILITHQLNLKLPKGIRLLGRMVNNRIHKLINHFDECLVPDFPGSINLSGELSHTVRYLKNKPKYIGLLSRLSLVEEDSEISPVELLIIISGPEKQRTVFENIVLKSIRSLGNELSYLIVRGRPDTLGSETENMVNHLSARKMKSLIKHAKYIICRSGYSTIMDLTLMKKTALLVPTPGQSEQEYIAELLTSKGFFCSVKQKEFKLSKAIQKLDNFRPVSGGFNLAKNPPE